MNYAILTLATLMVCCLPSALGIMCKKCTPAGIAVLCDRPDQLTEVNCDNETQPASGAMFDSCTTARVVANLGTTYAMECAVKVNSSNPSVVNCSLTEARICADAQAKVSQLAAVTIIDCSAICCTTNNCNVKALNEPATTAASATGEPTTKSGVSQIEPPLLGFLLIFLTVLFNKLDKLF